MKKITYFLIGALAVGSAVGIAAAVRHAPNMLGEMRATGETYTLTLDDTNQPTITGGTSGILDVNEYIQFEYVGTGLSVKSGRHIVMSSGTITSKKQIRKITNIKVTAPVNTNNNLTLYVGYSLADVAAQKYAYSIIGTSQVSVDTKCNYFALYSNATFGISTITITYECPGDESKYEVPTGSDSMKLVYGGSKKALTINDGAGTILDGQTVVTNADGLQYSYKYVTFKVEFKFPANVLASSNDFNFGLQGQKYMNADGGPNAAFQFGITNFSTGAWAMKVSGTSKDSGTLGSPFVADTWYEFKMVITAGSAYTLNCYIDDVLLSSTSRGSLNKNLYTYGVRYGSGSYDAISFRNLSLTGNN